MHVHRTFFSSCALDLLSTPYSYHRVSGARVFTDAGATAEFDDPDGGYYVEFDADYDE